MFQGKFEHTVDEKGRVAIPSPFRRKLGAEDSDTALMVTVSDKCLAAYALPEWEQKLNALAKLNQFDPRVMAFKRIFVGCAQECLLDKAGRILIPADLRRDAQIGRDCVIVGQIDKLELWSNERWRLCFNDQLTDQFGAISAGLADFNLAI